MPEYKKLFAEAFDGIKPASSDADFIGGILERADNMESETKTNKIQTNKMPEYREHKNHSVLYAVTGTAAAFAVITASLFGLKWLGEHGGLKERDPEDPGAGYHDDSTAAVTTTALPYTTPEGAATSVYPAEYDPVTDFYDIGEIWAQTGDYIIHFTGYEFNTVLLRVYYEVSRFDAAKLTAADEELLPACVDSGQPYSVIGLHEISRSDSSVKYIVDVIPDEPAHYLDVYFRAGTGEFQLFTAQCDNSNNVFRVPCDVPGADPHIRELFVSQSEVIIKYDADIDETELPSVEIYTKSDIPLSFADSHFGFYDAYKGIGYGFRGFSVPCDTSDIGRVYVGSALVYESPDMKQQEQPASSAGIECLSEEYDGRIFTVRLTGTELSDSSYPVPVFRSLSDPRTLQQNSVKEDNGIYTFWALLDIPEGQTETVQLVDLAPVFEGGETRELLTFTVEDASREGVKTAPVNVDMTEHGLPGVTLERLTLSRFGLELLFTSKDDPANVVDTPEVEVLLGDTIVSIKAWDGLSVYDEESGLYYYSLAVIAENMSGVDMSAASRVSVNGLRFTAGDFTETSADSIYDKLSRRRGTRRRAAAP